MVCDDDGVDDDELRVVEVVTEVPAACSCEAAGIAVSGDAAAAAAAAAALPSCLRECG